MESGEKRQAGAEIEVTPEMIEAGLSVYEMMKETHAASMVVESVYIAMSRAAST